MSYEEVGTTESRQVSEAVTNASTSHLYDVIASHGSTALDHFPNWRWNNFGCYVDDLIRQCALELIKRPDPQGLTAALFVREAIRAGGLAYEAECCNTLEWCARKDPELGAIACYVAALQEPDSIYGAQRLGPMTLFELQSPWCASVVVALARIKETRAGAEHCIKMIAREDGVLFAQIKQDLMASTDTGVTSFIGGLVEIPSTAARRERIPTFQRSPVGQFASSITIVMRTVDKSHAVNMLKLIEDEFTDRRLRLCLNSMLTVHRWACMRARGVSALQAAGVPWFKWE